MYSAGTISPVLMIAMWSIFVLALVVCAVLAIRERRGDPQAKLLLRHPLLSFGLQFGGFLSVVLTLAGTRIETGGKVWDLSTSM